SPSKVNTAVKRLFIYSSFKSKALDSLYLSVTRLIEVSKSRRKGFTNFLYSSTVISFHTSSDNFPLTEALAVFKRWSDISLKHLFRSTMLSLGSINSIPKHEL